MKQIFLRLLLAAPLVGQNRHQPEHHRVQQVGALVSMAPGPIDPRRGPIGLGSRYLAR
jgi:hypothetical protein